MRLICPNCDAQYEVPSDVIPDDGRDVQCSNCGQTWYQYHPDHMPEETQQAEEADASETFGQTEVLSDDDYTDEITFADKPDEAETQEDDAAPQPRPFAEPQLPVEQMPPADAEPPAPARRPLDPTIAEVLRAEAEREAQARKQEGLSGMESQPELGLPEVREDDAARRARQVQERMAKMRGYASAEDEDDDEDELYASTVAATGPRRELLPDIEEINSTLRSNTDRSPETDPGQTAQVEAREKRSSRKGFTLTVLLVALGAALYVFADQLAQSVPQAAPMLETFVASVDSARAWLDARIVDLLTWLDAAASGDTPQ